MPDSMSASVQKVLDLASATLAGHLIRGRNRWPVDKTGHACRTLPPLADAKATVGGRITTLGGRTDHT